ADPEKGGRTAEWNLVCLCRSHHRLKTFSGWRYSLRADGVLDITTETGRSVRPWPSGPLARARRVEDQVDVAVESDLLRGGTSDDGDGRTTECRWSGRAHDAGEYDRGVTSDASALGERRRAPRHRDSQPREGR